MTANFTEFPAAASLGGLTRPIASGNFWVTNFYSNTATKIRAGDGAMLGNYPVGVNPNGAIFDGANIWVANQNSDNVTKLRASDGAMLGTFHIGNAPAFGGFDGAHVWVVNHGSNDISKL